MLLVRAEPVNLREVPGIVCRSVLRASEKIAHTTTLPVPQAAQTLGPCHSMPFQCYLANQALCQQNTRQTRTPNLCQNMRTYLSKLVSGSAAPICSEQCSGIG